MPGYTLSDVYRWIDSSLAIQMPGYSTVEKLNKWLLSFGLWLQIFWDWICLECPTLEILIWNTKVSLNNYENKLWCALIRICLQKVSLTHLVMSASCLSNSLWRNKFLILTPDEEDTEEDTMEEIDPLSDDFSPDDSLPPLRRILNYYKSESSDNRYNLTSPSWGRKKGT